MEYILVYLLLPWWFSLPGYVANICPGIARTLPGGKIPVSRKVLGPNKTWAAIPAALVGAGIAVLLQHLLSYHDTYPEIDWLTLVLCFGLGVPLGDLVKSLGKRTFGYAPGAPVWIEKVDFLLMSYLFIFLTGAVLPLTYYLIPIGFMLLVHGPLNRNAYRQGWRNSPH
jgi:hypothetical protein